MNTEFIFGLMQKNKSGKIQLPLIALLFLIFISLPYHLQSQTQDLYTSNDTWIVPNCVTTVTVEVWGAGGGGNGNIAGTGGGGGGGGYSRSVITVTPGTSYPITVGTGGNGNTGTAGGNSWFGSATTVLARGGAGAIGAIGAPGGAIGIGTVTTAGATGGNVTTVIGISTPGAGGNAGGTGGGTGGSAGSNGNGPGGGGGGGSPLGGTAGKGADGEVLLTYNIAPSVIITNTTMPAICPGQSATLIAAQATTYSWTPGGATTSSITVSPGATTTYTVTGTSPGCTGKAVGTVTVYLPTINVNSVSICQEDIATLSASPAVSYIWAPGGETTASINVSPNSTTTYTVTGTGCGNTSTAISKVTVNCPSVPCSNANFGSCNFNGWTGTYCPPGGFPYPFQIKRMNIGSPNSASNSSPETNQAIMSSGFDPIVGGTTLPVKDPLGGSCSARLGNSAAQGGAESIMYKYVVKNSSTSFTYDYAVVLSSGNGHNACQQPYFKIRMWVYGPTPNDSTLIPCGTYDVDANAAASIPGFTSISINGQPGYYSTWNTVTIPLNAYIGQTVSAQFVTRDCCPQCSTTGSTAAPDGGCTGPGGGSHFCYAYISNRCQSSAIIATLACSGNAVLTAPTGAKTYSWKGPTPSSVVSGGSTNVATVNATGTYTVTMTTFGTSPCTYSLTYNLTLLNGVSVAVSSSTICQGGQAILTATGNANTYLWAPGGATAATIYVSPNSTTTYSVTGTSSTGCSTTKTGTVTVNAAPIITVSPGTICNGGSATLTASGGSTYSWSTGETSTSITVSPTVTTSYSVTSTISGATCPGVGTATVTVNPIPTVTVSPTTICSGQPATLTAGGANSYVWSTGASTAAMTASPTVTTTYTVIGNSLGCKDTAVGSITVNPMPVVTSSSTSICNGLGTTLNAGGANSYVWSTGTSAAAMSASPTVTTTYTVIGNSLGCLDTAVGTITIVYAPVVTVTPATVCVGSSATLTASGASGYSWSTGSTANPITVAPPSTSTYTVSGTGCPNTTTVTITVNPIPTVTVAPTTICAGAYATLTASGANSYSWSTGATTAAMTDHPVPTTTYTVIGNSLGCMDTTTVTITTKTAPTLTVASTTICIGNSSTLTASGAASYTWSNGATTASMTASPTVTTTYTITGVQLGIACPGTTTATITVNPLPLPVVVSDTICKGQGGPGTLTASGADFYTWSTGVTTAAMTASPTLTSTYTVTGTTLGCINTATGTITVNPIPVVSVAPITICAGSFTTLTASGADAYTWSTGATTASMTDHPVPTTTYTVIGNSLGCLDTTAVTITTKTAPTLTVASTTICIGNSSTLNASGAALYTWSNGATTASMTASPTVTTSYTITGVQLGIACPGTTTATITVNPLPLPVVNPATICNGQSQTLTASGADTYSWSNGETTAAMTVSPTLTTTYTVTGNSLGCINTATVSLRVNPIPVVAVNDTTICKGFTATLTAATADSYLWSTGETTASIILSPASTTIYSVTGTSLNCSKTATGTITVVMAPVVVVTPQSLCFGQTASLSASGAPSYTWNNGSTTNPLLVKPLTTTTYTVEGAGCPNTTTVTVTVNPLPLIAASSTTVCDGTEGTIRASDNLSSISTYAWSTGSDSSAMLSAPHITTTYTVVGTTAFGCKDTAVGTIVVKPNPIIKVTSVGVCPKATATITASGADSYLWSTGALTSSITAAPDTTTSYAVTGTTVWGCTGTGMGTIKIMPPPIAGFVASPNPTSMFDTEIHFSNQSSVDVVYWHWDYGNGDTLAPNTASPIYTYQQEVAKYTVTLIVHNSTPCWDTISSDIFIGPEFAFYIPNSFTPNGDKNNNGFRGTGVGIVNYHLQIFDRWGDLIWQSTNLDEYWNGKANNGSKLVQEDVYVWKVFLTDVFGREHHYIGTVTAVK